MTPSVRFNDEAEEELQAAVAWYERERPGFGVTLLDAVAEVVISLGERPDSHGLVPGVPAELGARRAFLRRFPYSVVFIRIDDEIRVIAVAHARRRPGYWHPRLGA